MTERVVVLGGTFDPVHVGHLFLANAARDAMNASEAWLVPARAPALRPDPVASPELRLEMLRAAAAAVPRVRVLDLELRRDGVSYTADTWDELSALHPESELWWLLGSDAARHIHDWRRAPELLRAARFAIVQRQGEQPFTDEDARLSGLDAERTRVLDVTPPRVSATGVRTRAAACESLDGLVPAVVAQIIERTGVYRGAAVMR